MQVIDHSKMINELQDYGANNSNFDTSFVDSLEEALQKYDGLTARQASALENIYNSFIVKRQGNGLA